MKVHNILPAAVAVAMLSVSSVHARDLRVLSSSSASAVSNSQSDADANATGGNASIVVEGNRKFTPDNCSQELPHCQILAEADALWAMGLHREAREHLRHIDSVNETLGATKRLVTGF